MEEMDKARAKLQHNISIYKSIYIYLSIRMEEMDKARALDFSIIYLSIFIYLLEWKRWIRLELDFNKVMRDLPRNGRRSKKSW